jgi:hypothetical protein
MPGPLVAPVHPARIAKRKVLHDSGKGNFADLNSQVDVIVHETIGINLAPEALNAFLKQQKETGPVLLIVKDITASITP